VALSVAVGLLEATYAESAARIILINGGPCTVGPGQVVGLQLSETLRSHTDLQTDQPNAKYTRDALKFYAQIARRAIAAGHAIDIFACNLDQVGLFEMKVCVDRTGGTMVLGDSFSMHIFQQSFKKMFEPDDAGYLQMGFNATIKAFCSREIRISGAVGNVASSRKGTASAAETEIGEGQTSEWTAGALDERSTVAFFFEVASQAAGQQQEQNKHGYLQFQTLYTHPSGRRRLRVTTHCHRYAEPTNIAFASGFDQEAAAAIMARYAVCKTEDEETLDVLRWCDRMLIRLVSRFADYRKDEPSTFSLIPEFSMYPQFMYHLRRSHFLQTFNASPDETAYYRTLLQRECVMNSLVMIQPALLEYSFDEGPPKPVLLDASSLKANVILVLDTFFLLVIWRGETIQQWYDAKYQESPEYENFRQLLIAPEDDCKQILSDRFPAPKFIQTAAGGSQARFLLSKVNPSVTHNTSSQFGGDSGGSVVLTDDVSLKVFMDHLIRLSVQS
jgi:protein transport protein SEC23